MTIKQLIDTLKKAPDLSREIYIPTIDDNGNILSTNKVGWNYDDNNDLELYEIA